MSAIDEEEIVDATNTDGGELPPTDSPSQPPTGADVSLGSFDLNPAGFSPSGFQSATSGGGNAFGLGSATKASHGSQTNSAKASGRAQRSGRTGNDDRSSEKSVRTPQAWEKKTTQSPTGFGRGTGASTGFGAPPPSFGSQSAFGATKGSAGVTTGGFGSGAAAKTPPASPLAATPTPSPPKAFKAAPGVFGNTTTATPTSTTPNAFKQAASASPAFTSVAPSFGHGPPSKFNVSDYTSRMREEQARKREDMVRNGVFNPDRMWGDDRVDTERFQRAHEAQEAVRKEEVEFGMGCDPLRFFIRRVLSGFGIVTACCVTPDTTLLIVSQDENDKNIRHFSYVTLEGARLSSFQSEANPDVIAACRDGTLVYRAGDELCLMWPDHSVVQLVQGGRSRKGFLTDRVSRVVVRNGAGNDSTFPLLGAEPSATFTGAVFTFDSTTKTLVAPELSAGFNQWSEKRGPIETPIDDILSTGQWFSSTHNGWGVPTRVVVVVPMGNDFSRRTFYAFTVGSEDGPCGCIRSIVLPKGQRHVVIPQPLPPSRLVGHNLVSKEGEGFVHLARRNGLLYYVELSQEDRQVYVSPLPDGCWSAATHLAYPSNVRETVRALLSLMVRETATATESGASPSGWVTLPWELMETIVEAIATGQVRVF